MSTPLTSVALAAPQVREISPTEPTGPQHSIGDVFADALHQAKQADSKATEMAERFANDDPNVGIHEVMIASEQANISMRYATTLKNKALEAYKELMNTQV